MPLSPVDKRYLAPNDFATATLDSTHCRPVTVTDPTKEAQP
jgi:hypothetical protein